LHQAGHVIGSHSRSHPLRFAELSPQAMRAEWSESRMVLEDMLGAEVRTASIPGGQYSRAAAEAAAEAGYRFLFTSEPVMRTHMVAGCRVIGRFTLRSSSTADAVESLVSGRRRERWRQWTI